MNHHVQVVEVEDKKILKIDIPAADRHDKPVYIGTDSMKGTYKKDYEGGLSYYGDFSKLFSGLS